MLVPALRADKLIIYLDDYGLANLYQKTGYILTEFSEQLGFQKHSLITVEVGFQNQRNIFYAPIESSTKKHLIFHEDWMIYAPRDLKSIISKGLISMPEWNKLFFWENKLGNLVSSAILMKRFAD